MEIRAHYLELFASCDFDDEVWFKWERVVTPRFPFIINNGK